MVQVPQNQIGPQHLAEWYKLKEQLKTVQANEMLLRKAIAGHYFPTPVEGSSNWHTLPDAYRLNMTHAINRAVDEPMLIALDDELREAGINVAKLIKRKPELVTSEYRLLTEEQRKLFDACLVIKEGSPQLSIEKPVTARQTKAKK